mmetsp:Transcript_31977/g.63345  ORF Transcript_31977/g.63345 Transcript_31977/m.63345 type:complete len:99 (+) Transcript_31977:100-396(+)
MPSMALMAVSATRTIAPPTSHVLTGGEESGAIVLYRVWDRALFLDDTDGPGVDGANKARYSSGVLPKVSDARVVALWGRRVAVSVDGDAVIMLALSAT